MRGAVAPLDSKGGARHRSQARWDGAAGLGERLAKDESPRAERKGVGPHPPLQRFYSVSELRRMLAEPGAEVLTFKFGFDDFLSAIYYADVARRDFAEHFHTLELRVGHRPSTPQIRSQRLCS